MTVCAAWFGYALSSLAGCGKSKVDQCNSFIDAANKSQTTLANIDTVMDNPAQLLAKSNELTASAGAIKEIDLKDEKVVAMRARYVDGLEGYAKSLTEAKGLAELPQPERKGKQAEFDKIVEKLQSISEKESKLIDEVNAYCSG